MAVGYIIARMEVGSKKVRPEMEERIKSYIEFLKRRAEDNEKQEAEHRDEYIQGLHAGYATAYRNVIGSLERMLDTQEALK